MPNAKITLKQLDKYREQNLRTGEDGRPYIMSRYSALKELYGEATATWTLQELAIQQA